MNHLINSLAKRWLRLFVAVVLALTIVPQFVNIKPVAADDGGYPWVNATYVDANYDWGYLSCPSSDTGCMAIKDGSYGTADPWVYNLRNCTSYVAWKINQVFGVNNISGWGNAYQWNTGYTSPQTYTVENPATYTPKVGDIAQWGAETGGGYGHVAYVYGFDASGNAKLDEYNSGLPLDNKGNPQWGLFYNGHTTASTSDGTPDHYIHIGTITPPTNTQNWSGNFASTWGTNRLDVFTPETWSSGSAKLDHEWFNGSWQPWDVPVPALTSNVASWPATVSWGANRIDFFARGTSNQLLHAYNDSNGWHNWENLGGCIAGAPAVASWGTNRLDVFAEGCSSTNLEHIWFNGSWQPWETLSLTGATMSTSASPAAVSWGTNRIDVFDAGGDGSLIQAYYDTSGWHNWADFSGSCITGAPGVSSWGVNRLDVFAQGCGDNGNSLNHIWYNGSWQPWETLPYSTQITSSPAAASWGTNRIDVFARGSNGHLIHQYDDSSGWHAWETLGGTLGT